MAGSSDFIPHEHAAAEGPRKTVCCRRDLTPMSTKNLSAKNSRLLLLLPLLALGCAGPTTSTKSPGGSAETSPMAASPACDFRWDLAGTRIIGCCCTASCPCRINEKPSYSHGCHYTEAVHIDRGSIDGVDVAGLDWVFVGRGFG